MRQQSKQLLPSYWVILSQRVRNKPLSSALLNISSPLNSSAYVTHLSAYVTHLSAYVPHISAYVTHLSVYVTHLSALVLVYLLCLIQPIGGVSFQLL